MHNKTVIKLRIVLFICEFKMDTWFYFCHYSFFHFLILKNYGFRCSWVGSWERPETPCSRKLDETCSKDYSVFLERYQGRMKWNWENIKQIFGEERRSRFCDIWAHSSQTLTSSTLSANQSLFRALMNLEPVDYLMWPLISERMDIFKSTKFHC